MGRGRRPALDPRQILGAVAMRQPRARRFPRGAGTGAPSRSLPPFPRTKKHPRIAPECCDQGARQARSPAGRWHREARSGRCCATARPRSGRCPRAASRRRPASSTLSTSGRVRVFGGALDLQAGIVGAPALLMGEAIELAQRREPPGACRRRHVGGLQMRQVAFDRRPGRQRSNPAPWRASHAMASLEVAAIGEKRVPRRPAFCRLRLEEGGNPVAVGAWFHHAGPSSRSCSAARRAMSLEPDTAQQDQRVSDIAGIALAVAEGRGPRAERPRPSGRCRAAMCSGAAVARRKTLWRWPVGARRPQSPPAGPARWRRRSAPYRSAPRRTGRYAHRSAKEARSAALEAPPRRSAARAASRSAKMVAKATASPARCMWS